MWIIKIHILMSVIKILIYMKRDAITFQKEIVQKGHSYFTLYQ